MKVRSMWKCPVLALALAAACAPALLAQDPNNDLYSDGGAQTPARYDVEPSLPVDAATGPGGLDTQPISCPVPTGDPAVLQMDRWVEDLFISLIAQADAAVEAVPGATSTAVELDLNIAGVLPTPISAKLAGKMKGVLSYDRTKRKYSLSVSSEAFGGLGAAGELGAVEASGHGGPVVKGGLTFEADRMRAGDLSTMGLFLLSGVTGQVSHVALAQSVLRAMPQQVFDTICDKLGFIISNPLVQAAPGLGGVLRLINQARIDAALQQVASLMRKIRPIGALLTKARGESGLGATGEVGARIASSTGSVEGDICTGTELRIDNGRVTQRVDLARFAFKGEVGIMRGSREEGVAFEVRAFPDGSGRVRVVELVMEGGSQALKGAAVFGSRVEAGNADRYLSMAKCTDFQKELPEFIEKARANAQEWSRNKDQNFLELIMTEQPFRKADSGYAKASTGRLQLDLIALGMKVQYTAVSLNMPDDATYDILMMP